MTVRSTRLIAYSFAASTATVLYTSPAGWRTIVKGIQLANNTGGPVSVWMQLFDGQNSVGVIVFQQSVAAGQGVSWNGWQVLHPGDYIEVYSGAAGVSLWVSGTLLQLTGQEPI